MASVQKELQHQGEAQLAAHLLPRHGGQLATLAAGSPAVSCRQHRMQHGMALQLMRQATHVSALTSGQRSPATDLQHGQRSEAVAP